jgi:rubrerythrin
MDYMASVELALKNEKTEMEFYRHEASRSRNSLARAMFDQLARDEEEHMTRIRELHEKLVSAGNWPEDVPIQVAGTNIRQVLDETLQKAGSSGDHDDDDLKALQKAAEFEAKGAEFYADLAASCVNPMEKNFFEFLAGIEREHRLSIMDSLAYLEDPEAWMMQHGRAGLDGA